MIFGGLSGGIFSPFLIVVLNCSPFQILEYFGLAFPIHGGHAMHPKGTGGGGEDASPPRELIQGTQGTPPLFIAGGLSSFEGVFPPCWLPKRGV